MQWLSWMPTTSIPICRLDARGLPIHIATGCFVEFRSRRFVLSVSHAVTMHENNWMAFEGFQSGQGSAYYRLGQFVYLREMTMGVPELDDVDFCAVEVGPSFAPLYQLHTPRALSDEQPRHIFQSDLNDQPDTEQVYAFSGRIQPEQHGADAVVTTTAVYPGLKYIHTDGALHVFRLPVPHPGHDAFRGCSGAPIVGRDKRVVALLCDGDASANTVRGVSIQRGRAVLEFLCRHTA